MAGRDSGNLAEETKGNPLIPNVDPPGEIIRFKVPGTQFVTFGREATVLIELCERYLQAKDDGKLRGRQKHAPLQYEFTDTNGAFSPEGTEKQV